MKIKLIEYTKNAMELLVFSKKTRLTMTGDTWEDVIKLPEEEKLKELRYVFGTIGSSWEFVSYTFMIEGVTRAFTHQLVRHRVGVSFAQQAMRVVDASDFEYLATGMAKENVHYHAGMEVIKMAYGDMIHEKVPPQDARGVLPTNILTNILVKINLRALSEMLSIRLCVKAQGEFQDVARALRAETIKVHPWAEPILQVRCALSGSCAFPGYDECPIKKVGLLSQPNIEAIKDYWEKNRAEAQPVGIKTKEL
jgi:flavin-dependent thymidylate synthase